MKNNEEECLILRRVVYDEIQIKLIRIRELPLHRQFKSKNTKLKLNNVLSLIRSDGYIDFIVSIDPYKIRRR